MIKPWRRPMMKQMTWNLSLQQISSQIWSISPALYVSDKSKMQIQIQIELKRAINWPKLMEIWPKYDNADSCEAEAKVNKHWSKIIVIYVGWVISQYCGINHFFKKLVQTYGDKKMFLEVCIGWRTFLRRAQHVTMHVWRNFLEVYWWTFIIEKICRKFDIVIQRCIWRFPPGWTNLHTTK